MSSQESGNPAIIEELSSFRFINNVNVSALSGNSSSHFILVLRKFGDKGILEFGSGRICSSGGP